LQQRCFENWTFFKPIFYNLKFALIHIEEVSLNMYQVTVDKEKCDGCEDEKSDPSGGGECDFCESCTGVCPTDAITITEL
jgi:ferredoxin